MNANYGKFRVSRDLTTRILFYGLFFVGPCALTESHALHIRKKQECSSSMGEVANEETRQEWHSNITTLDVIGFSAIGAWLVWLCLALIQKVLQLAHKRRSTQIYESRQPAKGDRREN